MQTKEFKIEQNRFIENEKKQKMIAQEIIDICKSNHLSYLEIENVLSIASNIAKNRSYLET